jgi:hypothetical protein
LAVCLPANIEANVKYGAALGIEGSMGIFSLGAEVDVGSLNAGTEGFALAQGWALTAAGGLPGGWAIGGKCAAESRILWTGSTYKEGCKAEASLTQSEVVRESALGRFGVKAYAGVGISVGISIPEVLQCMAELDK